MVPKIQEQIRESSLLNYGTWAYLGSPNDASGRYLFWTSVDTEAVGAGKKIPVIISRADGGFYIYETTTAERSNKGKGNTAQRASGDFARHLLANFPSEPVSYLPARILRAYFPRYFGKILENPQRIFSVFPFISQKI